MGPPTQRHPRRVCAIFLHELHRALLVIHCLSVPVPTTSFIAGGGNNIAKVVTLGAYAPSFSVSAIILRALLVIHCLYLHCLYLTDYVIYRHLLQGWEYYCSGCDGH